MANRRYTGFALPSIMIASVVMLIMLVTAVSAVATTRAALNDQFYNTLARQAAESGLEYAESCLDLNGSTVTWSDSTPLGPNTDCNGTVQVSCPTTVRNTRCGVIDSPTMRTTFRVGNAVEDAYSRTFAASGKVELLRKSNGAPWKSVEYTGREITAQTQDVEKARASQRFWYFGDGAGLDFGVSGATTTPVTASCGSSCVADEGSTVATDRNGNLLFWTNGLSIWNRNGTTMSGSTGLNASNSTTQAAAFFPLNKNLTKYVVVTNNAEDFYGNEGTLYYSVIDMTLDSGRGGVVSSQKNLPLWGTTTKYTSEALAAAPKADGSGFWVVTFRPGTTNLLVFEFNHLGLVGSSPREFSSGTSISKQTTERIGYATLNFNEDYTKLVLMAGDHCTGSSACSTRTGLLRLIDFNAKTGTPTNRFVWSAGTSQMDSAKVNAGYAADFSPSGDYIYSATIYPGRVYRYKIAGMATSTAIKASEEFIGSSIDLGGRGGGQVLSGPDGRMYVANQGYGYISVINNPDAATTSSMTLAQRQAAVGYIYNGITLRPGTLSRWGLPQMVTTHTPKTITF